MTTGKAYPSKAGCGIHAVDTGEAAPADGESAVTKIVRTSRYADAFHARSTTALAAGAIVLAILTAAALLRVHMSWMAGTASGASSAPAAQIHDLRRDQGSYSPYRVGRKFEHRTRGLLY